MKRSAMALIVMVLMLSGCDDNNIDVVKKSINNKTDRSITVGKALETRSDCVKGQWTSYKDPKDRTIVKYTCELPTHYIQYIKNSVTSEAHLKVNEAISRWIKIIEKEKNDGEVFNQNSTDLVVFLSENKGIIDNVTTVVASGNNVLGFIIPDNERNIGYNPVFFNNKAMLLPEKDSTEFCRAHYGDQTICLEQLYPQYITLYGLIKNIHPDKRLEYVTELGQVIRDGYLKKSRIYPRRSYIRLVRRLSHPN